MFRTVILFSLLLTACGSDDPSADAVARVYDEYLSRSEVARSVPFGTNPADSAAMADDYISQWILRHLLLRKAEMNLTDEQKDVSRQLEDYRASLITYAYESELIRQKLDTLVTDAEIEQYYRENPANFELKSNIIRLKYVKIPVTAPNADKLRNWLQSGDDKRLEQYCRLYAVNYLLNDENWLFMDDVIKEIPMQDYSHSQFSANRRFLDLSDKDYRYMVRVSGFMVKESHAPLSFERENIRNIILNKRKIQLIEQMQKDVYQDALNEKDIEIYKK